MTRPNADLGPNYFAASPPRPPHAGVLKELTAGHRQAFVYLPLALVVALEIVVIATAGSDWLSHAFAALIGTSLVFLLPPYLIYRRSVRHLSRLLRHGRLRDATVTRVSNQGRGLFNVALADTADQSRLVVTTSTRPEIAPGDRVELVVEPSSKSRRLFCVFVPGVGLQIGRSRFLT
jgi:hypothetical protein